MVDLFDFQVTQWWSLIWSHVQTIEARKQKEPAPVTIKWGIHVQHEENQVNDNLVVYQKHMSGQRTTEGQGIFRRWVRQALPPSCGR